MSASGHRPRKKGVLSGKSKDYFREWPPEYFAALAKNLHDYAKNNNIQLKIIIDLLPEERELGEQIVTMSGGVISLLTCEPNFDRYKATIKRMNLFITPNTGPMHIAAAVKTCIVALFVEWDPKDCGPYMENEYLLKFSTVTNVLCDDSPSSLVTLKEADSN